MGRNNLSFQTCAICYNCTMIKILLLIISLPFHSTAFAKASQDHNVIHSQIFPDGTKVVEISLAKNGKVDLIEKYKTPVVIDAVIKKIKNR